MGRCHALSGVIVEAEAEAHVRGVRTALEAGWMVYKVATLPMDVRRLPERIR